MLPTYIYVLEAAYVERCLPEPDSSFSPHCDEVIEKMGRNLGTSEAVITPGFKLLAKWIIHAVAPMCMGLWNDTIKTQMEETYR